MVQEAMEAMEAMTGFLRVEAAAAGVPTGSQQMLTLMRPAAAARALKECLVRAAAMAEGPPAVRPVPQAPAAAVPVARQLPRGVLELPTT